jgi:hypothetical protein
MPQTGWRGVVRPVEGGPGCVGQAFMAAGWPARCERAHGGSTQKSRICRREHHSVRRRRREHQSVGHRRCRRGYESPQQGPAAQPSRPHPVSSHIATRPTVKTACWHGMSWARPSRRPSEAERLRLVHDRPGRVRPAAKPCPDEPGARIHQTLRTYLN